jgi:glycosyltransferase involved in cell wall biosynthesis
MNVRHVLAGVDEQTAGPSQSVTSLARALEDLDQAVDIDCVLNWRAPPATAVRPVPHRHRQDWANVPGLKNLCLSSAMRHALEEAAERTDVIHAHGLWLMPNVYPAWTAKRSGIPLVLSPRGMLGSAALAFSSRRKALFWALAQKRAVEAVACLHATSEAEYEEMRAFGLRNPVAVIPNGVAAPSLTVRPVASSVRTLLTIGRIHPKKGLDNLIRAWALLETRFPDWRLRIVGPDEIGHAGELAALGRELGLAHVRIEPPLFGADKTTAYQAAELFVLPTRNENFAMTVAESLAAGTPVVATKGAPWQGLQTKQCGWWVDIGVEPLAEALAQAMALPPAQLQGMGARGQHWMGEDFSWNRVAADMLGVYRWLVGTAPPPAQVRFD